MLHHFPSSFNPRSDQQGIFPYIIERRGYEKKIKISGLNNKKSIPNIAQIIDIWILGREWLEMCFCYDVRPILSNSKM